MGNSSIDPALLATTPGSVIAAALILPLLSSLAIGLRLHARRWQSLTICADDLAVLASAVLIGLLGLILIVGSATGSLGRHSSVLYYSDGVPALDHGHFEAQGERVLMAFSAIEKPALGFVKISTVLLFRRIFGGRIFFKIATATCIVLATMTIAFFIASLVQCPTGNWDAMASGTTQQHSCSPQELTTFSFAIFDCITDLFILSLPLPMIWHLQMDLRQRFCMCLVFLLGTCSFIIAIIRAAIVGYFTWPGTSTASSYRDLIGIMSSVAVLSLAEASLAVVATCIPTFRNLLATYCHVDFPGGSILLSRFEPSQAHEEVRATENDGSSAPGWTTTLVPSEEHGKHLDNVKLAARCQSDPITVAADGEEVDSRSRILSQQSRSSCDLIVVQEEGQPHVLRLTTTFPKNNPSTITSTTSTPTTSVKASPNPNSESRDLSETNFPSKSPSSSAAGTKQSGDSPSTRGPRNVSSKGSFSGGVSPLQELSDAASTLRAPTPTVPAIPAAFSPHSSVISPVSSPSSASAPRQKATSQLSSSSTTTRPISPLPTLPPIPISSSLSALIPAAAPAATLPENGTQPTTPLSPGTRSLSPAELGADGPPAELATRPCSPPVELDGNSRPTARARTPAELEAEEMMMGTLRCYDGSKSQWT